MRPTTLESLRLASDHLTIALTHLREARDSELRGARDCRECEDHDGLNRQEQHARHLLYNRALIEAERLATAAREILS
jgi:hypothetical protein